MTVNLIDLVQRHLSGPVLRQISSILGESEATTEATVTTAVPTAIAALMKQASTPSGASALASHLDRVDTGLLGNLSSSLAGGAKGLMDGGASLARNLFGSQLDPLSDGLGRATGMGKGAITSLLALLTPIIAGVLSREKREKGLDANGLMSLLGGQKSFISGLVPADLSDALGLGAVGAGARAAADRAGDYAVRAGDYVADTGRAAVRATQYAAGEGTSILKKLLPFVVLLLLGLIAWRWIAGRSTSEVAAARPLGTDVKAAGPQADLSGTIDRAAGALRGVTDVESAKAALPALQAVAREIETLSSTIASQPSGVRSSIAASASTALSTLKSLGDKALAIPGVGEVLRPVMTSLTDGLTRLRG